MKNKLIGRAVRLSEDAKEYFSTSNQELFNSYLPCNIYETKKTNGLDDDFLVSFDSESDKKTRVFHREHIVIEPILVCSSSMPIEDSKEFLRQYCEAQNLNIHDYHIQQEQKENVGWVTIEGTEIHF